MTPQAVADIVKAKLAARRAVDDARGFDLATVMAFCAVESGDWRRPTTAPMNERAFAHDHNGGSYGLMQIDLPTARDRGYQGTAEGLYDPQTNIEYGLRQLEWTADYLRRRSRLSLQNLAAGYNEGVGNVVRGVPDPVYVGRIERARQFWQSGSGSGIA